MTINACVGVRDGCPMDWCLNADRQIEVSLGGARQSIELIFDPPALRRFVELAGTALEQVAVAIIQGDSDSPQASGEATP